MSTNWVFISTTTALTSLINAWITRVDRNVPEPYLDEVFHIPQAKHYCEGRFDIWDPKLTTPPGLYILSVIAKPIFGCSTSALRRLDGILLSQISVILIFTYAARNNAVGPSGWSRMIESFGHSALNIALFPPLFFFYGLYYTDSASTLSVIIYYWIFLRSRNKGRASSIAVVVAALASLLFRQTNIFWVGVAPLLLTIVDEIDSGHEVVRESMRRRSPGFSDTMSNIIRSSWKHETIYAPPVSEAYFEDFISTILSIAVCGLKALTQPKRIESLLYKTLPHLIVIALFASFVIVNGGVVLGDKTNHVATINLPQMFYIWPYFVFFSWPMVLPQLLLIPAIILSKITTGSLQQTILTFVNGRSLPRLSVLIAMTSLACVVVHFNTVVHPFMLADNRHYTFYVFKLLLRPWWVRYAITPLYVLCGWSCLSLQAEPKIDLGKGTGEAKLQDELLEVDEPMARSDAADRCSSPSSVIPDGTNTASTSFIVIFLGTTALQLCTAPLFEPRYLIIPWLFWRLHLPHKKPQPSSTAVNQGEGTTKLDEPEDPIWSYDFRLILETVWYLIINIVTGYIFINWTFTWASEPLSKQRFMW